MSFRAIIALFAVVPYLLVSLLAPNTMLAQDRDGVIRTVICSGQGTQVKLIDMRTGEIVEEEPDTQRERCVWSIAHSSTLLPAPTAIISESRFSCPAEINSNRKSTPSKLANFARPPSRAPPISI